MADTQRSANDQQDGADEAPADAGGQSGEEKVHVDVDADGDYGQDDQSYVDRDNVDFDVDKGMYNGTAVDGTSSIPGPHERQDDVEPESDEESDGESDGESDAE